MTLQFHATSQEVMRAVDTLHEFSRQRGVAEKDLFGLCLALEECASNIVNHALKRDPDQTFQVIFHYTDDSFTIELRDHGPVFDPTAAAERKTTGDADLPGGWGIQLVRRFMDEIRYSRENDENVLRLTKRFASPPVGRD